MPARNTIFLSFALAYAETIGAFDIFIGANEIDYSGYPDCRPEYLQSFENMANLATAATVSGQQKFKIILLLLFIVLLLVCCHHLSLQHDPSKNVPVVTAVVSTQDVPVHVTAFGTVTPTIKKII